jgi:transposase
MSEEEVRRAGVLSRVCAGELKQTEAALKLGVSYRQLKRLYKRYRKSGTAGLIQRSAGRRSGRSRSEAQRDRALAVIREHYGGAVGERFGPTLAAEHLAEEHGLKVDHETLRRWMLATGLWTRERKRKRYRQRRARKEHFGELLQMDGSFHRWLEERGPRGCLINLVDDATGRAVAWIAEEETTWAVADVLRAWVEQ